MTHTTTIRVRSGARLVAAGLLMGLAARGPARASTAVPGPGVFQPVGPMLANRLYPTVTLLPDDSVLITGALVLGPPTTSTERFDPKANQFVADRPMSVSRVYHAAAPLLDGRVLVLGGFDDKFNGVVAAEVYDPVKRVFTRVGDMAQPRWRATATLLLDGRVLVVGGNPDLKGSAALATAELFDPATGKFQPTGSLSAPRFGHAAVRLSDGRVAIVGDGLGKLRLVEIYDPTTGTFSPHGETAVARAAPVALPLPGNRILLAGGLSSGTVLLDSIEIDDPATGQATITGHLSRPRSAVAGVALADGRILAAGGIIDANLNTTAEAELIDPVTGQASPAASMNGPRGEAVAILLRDGRALLVGGIKSTGVTPLYSAEVYVP